MSGGDSAARVLACMTGPGAVLAPERGGARFGVYPRGDRRRRPLARASAELVRALETSGALAPKADGFELSEAGRRRARREAAPESEAYQAQHAPLIDRTVIDAEGELRTVRGFEPQPGLRRLAALRDASGKPWLSAAELAAATQLRADWELTQIGLVRGSDWRAPPMGSTPRGPARSSAMDARLDARDRLDRRLRALTPMLRRVIERVCFHEEGVEALERSENWPARSGKLALKLALAQAAG